jgi:hypothetical protein
MVGAAWPGARLSAGKKLALIGAPSKDGTITSRAEAAGAETRASSATTPARRTRAFIGAVA